MAYIKLKSDTKPADLAKRIYATTGSPSAATLKRAQSALLRANPGLENATKIPRGTMLFVPEVSGLAPSKDVASTVGGTQDAVDELQRMAGEFNSRFRAGVENEQKALQASLTLLSAAAFKKEAKRQAPWSDKRLTDAREAATKLQADRKAAAEEVTKAMNALKSDLAALTKKLGND